MTASNLLLRPTTEATPGVNPSIPSCRWMGCSAPATLSGYCTPHSVKRQDMAMELRFEGEL